jgi:hypothetical protein
MLRRTGFLRKARNREGRDPDRVRETPGAPAAWTEAAPVDPAAWAATPKPAPALQHKGYMDTVRRMPCAHCGKAGPSQFCHRDQGKGLGIKTDCREGFPGCAQCHELLGSSGKIPRIERRELELLYGMRTRGEVVRRKKWPADLAPWQQKSDNTY